MRRLPNMITSLRLALSVATFAFLVGASRATGPGDKQTLVVAALAAFVIAALSDFVDGWLARKLKAESVWGAILDPIADKVLVCGAILGLVLLDHPVAVAIPGAMILFREFTVSALRETVAGKGVRLPVTRLAKWKTTLQLVALAAEITICAGDALGGAALIAHGLLWIAALVTWITGAQYWAQARRALNDTGKA